MAGVPLDNLTLVETAEKIFIHPPNPGPGTQFMIIDRISDEITVSADPNVFPHLGRIRTVSFVGIIGIIDLVGGPYLVIAKSRIQVGKINISNIDHTIWQLDQFEIIPFRKTILHLTEKQAKHNSTYLEMLDTVLTTPCFYFSYTYDLTRNLQRLDLNAPQPLIGRAVESKFVWNSHLLKKFEGRQELHQFCVLLIHGFVSMNSIAVRPNKVIKFIIISRRSSKRAGTRLFSRGVDSEGHVSNFVETEQIVEYNKEITSFVQIRGSIPLFWTQKPNLRYKPKPEVTPQMNQDEAFTRHFLELRKYGKVVCVNLVNQTGSEASLGAEFGRQAALPRNSTLIHRYEAFDFHREWGRLENLMNRLSGEIDDFGYFASSGGQKQKGIFRTNCIDCLDRTNVIQGLIGKHNFENVLKRFGILNPQETVSSDEVLNYMFKNVWANNGDVCSIQYSGTGALKSDFTRTGKRTIFGALQDCYNSVVRYIKNNFSDGFRQDAMDLFLGSYIVEEQAIGDISPLIRNRTLKFYTLPLFLVVSLAMSVSVILSPSEYSTKKYLHICFWGFMVLATGGGIMHFGREFVDNPVLSDVNN